MKSLFDRQNLVELEYPAERRLAWRKRQLERPLTYVGLDVRVDCAERGKYLFIDDLLFLESSLDRFASCTPDLIPSKLPPCCPAILCGFVGVKSQPELFDEDLEMLHYLRGMNDR